ncbi:ribonuclease E/G [Alterisphingorhabdus coralli]|uniref:Ribonuclease E/G n=1 Tax=Alterisphingorhabdus coralli TaxID=3071408 RepID=A0AA97I2M5_9SPHN|nr:ribonuclease E/G [Parasphingorhabdus sp. SCSIO 66989]WOE75890.1 ribonuclease E/G [Parasphingorhabdus sp. SCSIO 66989]
MSRWLVERGIGETRAALIEDDRLVAARIWRDSLAPHAGQILDATLETANPPQARLSDDSVVALTRVAKETSEGGNLRVRVRRGPIVERSGLHDRFKRARAVPVRSDTAQITDDWPALLGDSHHPAEMAPLSPPPAPDPLAQCGWEELMGEAISGVIAFPQGELLITPTPAMTVIDVDGSGPTPSLACNAAKTIALALHRLDIGGVIAIDFPTLERREDRQRAAEAFDAAMIGPFERTAINGFGLMQVVRKRLGPSLIELSQLRPLETSVLQLLRKAERWEQPGDIVLVVDNAGADMLNRNNVWLEQLSRRTGRSVTMQPDARSREDYHIASIASGLSQQA